MKDLFEDYTYDLNGKVSGIFCLIIGISITILLLYLYNTPKYISDFSQSMWLKLAAYTVFIIPLFLFYGTLQVFIFKLSIDKEKDEVRLRKLFKSQYLSKYNVVEWGITSVKGYRGAVTPKEYYLIFKIKNGKTVVYILPTELNNHPKTDNILDTMQNILRIPPKRYTRRYLIMPPNFLF